jgi:uncharacterized RDD family membrane protein YckC
MQVGMNAQLDNRRLLAGLIDVLIVGAGAALVLAAAGALGGDPSSIGAPLAAVVLGWALYYYFACESGAGQTVGKRLMKLRVVRTDGSPAGMREIVIRTALRVIDMQFMYLVGLVVMLVTGERRGRLGDLAGDTMIVATDVPQAPPAPVPAPVVSEPDIATPALTELAEDIAVVTAAAPPAEVEEAEVDKPEIEAEAEEPEVTVRTVETVSAIDLVMGDEPAAERVPGA